MSPHRTLKGFYTRFLYLKLKGKIQKHQTFEAEVAAHNNSITGLNSTGEAMIKQQHYATQIIKVWRN